VRADAWRRAKLRVTHDSPDSCFCVSLCSSAFAKPMARQVFAAILLSDCAGASPSGPPQLFSGIGDSRSRITASKNRDFTAECGQALRPHLCSLSCQCGAKA
jgi:hypothetical protein